MIYDYEVTTGAGEKQSLADYKGKVILIVNTATGCGFTPHYKDIEAMYEKYHDQGLEVVDVPCNQFAGQTPGTDDEDVEDYRARVLASVGVKSFGGNRKDYQDFIDSLDDVGACKPKRRALDSPYINIWILDSNHNVPTSTIVSDVQEAVDPEENSGEGEGMAPCCHHVKVYAASSVTVNVSATLTLDDGYTILSVKDSVEAAIAAYLYGLRVAWESEGLDSMYVRIAQIEARILSVTGVLDVADVLINSDDENIELSFEKVPVMGEVTLSV